MVRNYVCFCIIFRGSMSSLQSGNSGFSVLSGRSQASSCPSRWLTPSPLIFPLQLDPLGQLDETSVLETSSCLLTTTTSVTLLKSTTSQNSITPSESLERQKATTLVVVVEDTNNAWPSFFTHFFNPISDILLASNHLFFQHVTTYARVYVCIYSLLRSGWSFINNTLYKTRYSHSEWYWTLNKQVKSWH